MPWRLYTYAGGDAFVCRDRESADDAAMRVADNSDHCAIVAPVDLPLEPSESLFVMLSDGTRKDIEL